MTESGAQARPRTERGFALILAILSLLLLTFLGLTLATTTSTELQIATNYRWGQQAMYNAEAGLEVAKVYLTAGDWENFAPIARGGTWTMGTAIGTLPPSKPAGVPDFDIAGHLLRHWENASCDKRGQGVGYGLVLAIPAAEIPGFEPAQYQSAALGKQLNGAFTLWVRRQTLIDANSGNIGDDANNAVGIITSEGVAPYTTDFYDPAAASRRAVVVREMLVMLGQGQGCDPSRVQTQVGANVSGPNFYACVLIGAGGLQDAFGQTARDAGGAATSGFGSGAAGTLAGIPNVQ